MIEALDTVVTNWAVSASTRFYALAVGTQLISVDVLEHIQEVDILIAEVAWLGARCHEEEESAQECDP